MSDRPWVYVAGPYTVPDPIVNTREAILVGNQLYARGLMPIVPHLSLLSHLIVPQPYEHWLEFDFELLSRCDVLLRLPGASEGADCEVEIAMLDGIPVCFFPRRQPTDFDELAAELRYMAKASGFRSKRAAV